MRDLARRGADAQESIQRRVDDPSTAVSLVGPVLCWRIRRGGGPFLRAQPTLRESRSCDLEKSWLQ